MTPRNEKQFNDAVDLVQLLGSESAPTELLGVLASHSIRETPLLADTLVTSTETIDRTDATMFLDFLRVRGYVTETSQNDAVQPDYNSCIRLLALTRETQQLLSRVKKSSETVTTEFVCTLPVSDPGFDSVDPVDFGMQQITTRLLSLCRNATNEIVLTSPFLEVDGMDWLLPGLTGALERGINLTLVSRELRPGQPNHDAVQELFDIAVGQPGDLEVYDYYEPQPHNKHPKYTLHSKLLVADRTTAYIGSANFTRYGFTENLEIGVVIEAPEVNSLTDLVAHLIAESGVRVRK